MKLVCLIFRLHSLRYNYPSSKKHILSLLRFREHQGRGDRRKVSWRTLRKIMSCGSDTVVLMNSQLLWS